MKSSVRVSLAAMAALLGSSPASFGLPIVVGQVDDFQGGTTQGWTSLPPGFDLAPTPPQHALTGGPAGAGDSFLSILGLGALGLPPYAANSTQWAGDYVAGGVDAISLDAFNPGPTDLFLRLQFFSLPGGGGLGSAAYTTNAQMVPSGSPWSSLSFSIAPGDLTLASFAPSGATIADALANTTHVVIYHQAAGEFSPLLTSFEAATFGVDNVRASGPGPGNSGGGGGSGGVGGTPVPDTGTTAGLLGLALVLLGAAGGRRARVRV